MLLGPSLADVIHRWLAIEGTIGLKGEWMQYIVQRLGGCTVHSDCCRQVVQYTVTVVDMLYSTQ